MRAHTRILALLTALILIVGLFTGCSDTKDPGTVDPGTTPGTDPGTDPGKDMDAKENMIALILNEGGLGDHGFNDGAAEGLKELERLYGIKSITVEPADVSQGELIIREVAEEGYGLIIIMDYTVMTETYKVVNDYPDQIFVPLGMPTSWRPEEKYANVVDSQFLLPEHTFLAGVAAAFVATDGNEIVDGVGNRPGVNIGCIFPTESVGFYRYFDAFQHGAHYYNDNVNIQVDYTVGNTDTALCQTVAENMIKNQNCDVIWTCCGTAGLGGLQACRMNNAFGIGVDNDQDAVEDGYILTSVVRDTGRNMVILGELWQEGTLLEQDEFIWGVGSEILRLTDMSVIEKHVTNPEKFQELKTLLADLKEQIASGELVPFDTYTHGEVRFEQWWADQKK
ncbi:BMP family lipoprotein [Feifania hominis]|uniref:BMP family ABC transporter substrate-binding protein n=1 Tax=Feifania hominis TaxID=2763660 RepID=A0A926DG86_9FIRM|nr:BMP family ABC transporter substrate-binding protein [Feifania hominis]MBC8536729.1 BMP family ABC transporter substrate-binding protein [Feifania hominis]